MKVVKNKKIIKKMLLVMSMLLIVAFLPSYSEDAASGLGENFRITREDGDKETKDYYLEMKFAGTKRSEGSFTVYRTNKVRLFVTFRKLGGGSKMIPLELTEADLYSILWHDKELETVDDYYGDSFETVIRIPLVGGNGRSECETIVDGTIELSKTDSPFSIEELARRTNSKSDVDEIFENLDQVDAIRVEMESEIGATKVPYSDPIKWLEIDGVEQYYENEQAFSDKNKIDWANRDDIIAKLNKSELVFLEIEIPRIDPRISTGYNANIPVGDSQTIEFTVTESNADLVDKTSFEFSDLSISPGISGVVKNPQTYPTEKSSKISYRIQFNSTGTYTLDQSCTVTNIKDSSDVVIKPSQIKINVYDPSDVDPGDVTTDEDIKKWGNVTFYPASSYSVSGNRLGWVNHSIPVRVTFNNVPNVRQEKDGYNREYQFYLKESYKEYYTYKGRDRTTWLDEIEIDQYTSYNWKAIYDAEQRGEVETSNMQSNKTFNIASGDTITIPEQNKNNIGLELINNWWNPHPYWKDHGSATTYEMEEDDWEDMVDLEGKEEDEDDDEDYRVSSGGPSFYLYEVGEREHKASGETEDTRDRIDDDPELMDDVFGDVKLPSLTYTGGAEIYKIDVTDPTLEVYEHKKAGTSTDFRTEYWTKGQVDINYKLKDDIETIESGVWENARMSLAGTNQYVTSGGSRLPSKAQGYRVTDLMKLTTGSNVTGKYKLDSSDLQDVARNVVMDPNDWFWIDNDEPTDNMTGDIHLQNIWVNHNVAIGIDLEDRNESGMTDYNFNYRRQYVSGENSKSESNTPSSGSSAPNANNETTLKDFTWNRTFTEEGVHTITGSAEDAAGNSMTFKHGPFKIDTTAPRIDDLTILNTAGDEIPNLEFVTDFSNKIKFRVSDNLSGVEPDKAVYWFTYYDESDDEKRIEDETGAWRYEFGLSINSRAPGEDLSAIRPSDVVEVEVNKDITKFINLKSGHINFYYWIQDRAGNIRTNSDINPFTEDPDDSDGGGSKNPGDDNEGRTYDPDDDGNKDGMDDNDNPLDLFKMNKIEGLRIVDIKDLRWGTFFDGTGKYLPVRDMGVYRRNNYNSTTISGKVLGYIGLGYEVNFEIDTIGFDAPADYIDITTSYYAESRSGKIERVDVFVKNGSEYRRIDDLSQYETEIVNQRLINSEPYRGHRTMSTEDINASRTWPFRTLIPYDIRVLPYSNGTKDTFDQYGNDNTIYKNKDYRNILVVFDIVGTRAGHDDKLYYTEKETEWAYVVNEDNAYIPEYGISKTGIRDENAQRWINLDLIGRGNYKGQVFWYKLKQTADDLGFEGGISH